MQRRIFVGMLIGFACISANGCGDSEEDAPPARPVVPPENPAGAGPITPAGAATKGLLTTYTHVEERMDSDEEKATIRHQFRESDFVQDLEGENRDPFRSFILATGIIDQRPGLPVEASDICTSKQMVATNYSVRDLRLVGIVSRGLKRYALMQDSANLGQIVSRGDCVGKEKARVKEIGTGYVTLEIMPEVVADGAPRIAEERSIRLYPEELPVSRELEGESMPAPVLPPASFPPPRGAAESTAVPPPVSPKPRTDQ
jgi:Tfp pilus assembly protein PilP